MVASPNAAKVVHGLGYTDVHILNHGELFNLENKVEIKAFPGSQIGPTLLENGYLIQDLESNSTLYYEPHGNHSAEIKQLDKVDVVITPIVDLNLPLLGPIIKGMNSTLEVAKSLQPKFILPTAAGGDVEFEGILNNFIQANGNVEEFQTLLEQQNLSTQVISPQPGEKVDV